MTVKPSSRVVSGAVSLLLVAGLGAAQDVTCNAMPGINFGTFKTYKWVEISGGFKVDQIVDAQIKMAIDGELATKGLAKSADDKADLYVK